MINISLRLGRYDQCIESTDLDITYSTPTITDITCAYKSIETSETYHLKTYWTQQGTRVRTPQWRTLPFGYGIEFSAGSCLASQECNFC